MTKYGACKSCGANDYEYIAPYRGFENIDLATCRQCGLMQAQPIPSADFLKRFYEDEFGKDPLCGAHSGEDNEPGFRRRALLQFDSVKKIFRLNGKTGKILDVGCHAGSFLSLFKERGWEVVGLDPNPRAAWAEKWYGIKVQAGMFEKGLFKENTFDAILHSHVLEHVPDPKSVLQEFCHILKPGGWVFIEVPNETLFTVKTGSIKPHLYFFSASTLRRLAESAGFEVVAVKTLGIGARRSKLWSRESLKWLKRRWRARYNARGRLNLFTFMPFFGRLFKEDRYFREAGPDGVMLRIYLRKPGLSKL